MKGEILFLGEKFICLYHGGGGIETVKKALETSRVGRGEKTMNKTYHISYLQDITVKSKLELNTD